MSFGSRRSGRALLLAGASAALLAAVPGCSYLQWRHEKKEQRAELEKSPTNLLLEKDYAPQDCFGLIGRIAIPKEQKSPLLVAAFAHASPPHEVVGSREIIPETGYYGLLLPTGQYDLVFFADLNHDGYYETNEVVGRTPPESPVTVGKPQTRDGVTVPALDIAIDLAHATTAEAPIRIAVVPRPFVVESVDDPIFAPEMGEMGVYQPNLFLARTQSWFYSVGMPDFSKVQLLLVHGIDGTPRDFKTLIASIDRSRYHIWLFYYPSGLGLDQLGVVLAGGVERLAGFVGAKDLRVALVAHSMGGLVSRRALNELCRNGTPRYLRVYASFDSPYGGIESAAGAVKRGTELVPSWIDVAAGSPFLTRLYATPFPKDLPFHLFFGWGLEGDHGPGLAGDGTIALPSQLDPHMQAAATRMMGYGATHVGILSDPKALDELNLVLAETTSSAPVAKAGS
jgi:pimeloyl-ACP methyl ester carboxylesterase